MIILCNPEQALKDKFEGIIKVIISCDIQNPISEDSVMLDSLLPTPYTSDRFYNNEINKKEYRDEYLDTIETDDNLYSLFLTLIMCYKNNGALILVCSEDEKQFFYMDFLMNYIGDKFGINCMEYNKFKKKDKLKYNTMSDKGEAYLNKKIMKYSDLLFDVDPEELFEESENEDSKKKKKKKNKGNDSIKELKKLSFKRFKEE